MAEPNNDEPIVPQGVTLREFDDTRAARKAIYDGTLDALKKRFPLENKSYRLELSNVRYTGPQDFTLAQQKQALLTDKNLHTPVSGHFRLIRKSDNAVVDEKDEVVMNVPYYTDRGTIINNGSEYTVANQLRLRPGVYTRVRRSGDVETQFNVRPGTGRGFRLRMEPSTGVIMVNVGHANMPLYPLLRTLGVTDQQMIKAWGADVAHANAVKSESVSGRSAIDKLYQAFAGYNAEAQDLVSKERYLAETLPKFELDPGVTSRTLGLNANGITPEVLLRASAKMFNVNRGDEKPDDRDNPGFANIFGIEDLYRERIEKDAGRLSKDIMWKISRAGSLKPVGRAAFSGWHDELLHGSGLAMPGDNSNPMALEEQLLRATRLGEGGISSPDLLTDEARAVNPGNLNFIGVLEGPENEKIGADVRLGVYTRKGSDGRLYSLFLNRQGRKEYVACDDASDHVIGFPNADPKAASVPAMKRGRVQMVPREEVDYFVPATAGIFSSNVNLNPMPTSVQGGRQFYAAKFWGQYLPTAEGESPLVDSLMPDGRMTWSEHYGRRLGTLKAGVDGTVTKVTDKGVTVADADGKKHFIETVTDFPFNGLTGLTYTPTVKVGDAVKADDMVAASNFVDRKTGGLAMGRNMKVAWIPAKGHSVSGDTSVLWRRPDGSFTFGPIANVQVGPGMGSIAVDPKTGEQHIIDATAWMIHRPDSKMYCVTMSNGATVKVTGSHGMMKYDGHHGLIECRADKLVPGKDVVAFIRPELPFGTGPDRIDCESTRHRGAARTFPLDRDFGWLVGIFLSEGCVVYRNGIPHSVSIACTERDIIDKIAEIAARFEITCTYRKSEYERAGHGMQVTSGKATLGSSALASWFAAHTGRYAWGKYLPDIVWTGPREFADGLIDGYICGDGCITDKQCTISTSSPVMADGLCLLLGAIGVRANNRRYRSYTNPAQKHAIHMVYMYRETVQNLPRISLRRKDDSVAALRAFYANSKKFKIGDIIPIPSGAPYAFSNGKPTVSRDKARAVMAEYLRQERRAVPGSRFIADAMALIDGPLMWSRVQSVTEIPSEEYVYDLEMRPYGTFVVGYGLVVHNSYEDAVVISEEAAKKLATSRLYGFDTDPKNGGELGLNRYMSAFPGRFTKEQYATLDDSGVVKEGTVLHKGDPISVAVGPKLLTSQDATLGKLSKVLRGAFTDKAQVWDHDYPGTVVSSTVFRGRAKVNIKATPPMQVGDKLSPRFALKGVVGAIIDQDKMPRDAATNEPYDILMNPMGIPSRVAPGQLIESALGKLAKATGRQIRIPQDPPPEGWAAWAKAQLDAAGVAPTADIFDPETGKTIKGIGDGYVYWQAMHHIADKKLSAKPGAGGYTADLQPAKGGKTGAKRSCFTADQAIRVIHGEESIGHIVDKRIPEYVWTRFNDGSWGYSRVTNWFCRKGKMSEVLSIDVDGLPGSDNCSRKRVVYTGKTLHVTWQHHMFSPDRGEILARDIRPGDWLTSYGYVPTDDQFSLLMGSMLGDASICNVNDNLHKQKHGVCTAMPYYSEQHSHHQDMYVNWKIHALGALVSSRSKTQNKSKAGFSYRPGQRVAYYDVRRHDIVESLKNMFYRQPDGSLGTKNLSHVDLDLINDVGIVAWFVDDGCITYRKKGGKRYACPSGTISSQGFTQADNERLAAWLSKRLCAPVTVRHSASTYKGERRHYTYLGLSADACHRMTHLVARYMRLEDIPNSKTWLRDAVIGLDHEYVGVDTAYALGSVPVLVTDVRPYSDGKHGPDDEICLYDMTVEGSHKYCASDCLVSNSGLDAYAMLSHGATEVLKDIQVVRGTKNEDYWKAVRSGGPLPMPQVPFVYKKAMNLLRAGGINVVEGQNATDIMPMTDKDTERMTGGRLILTSQMLDDEMKDIPGGLFDPHMTGGSGNQDRWAAIKLPEAIPNPVMEEPVRRVLGLTTKKLQAVISGEERLDGRTGGDALAAALGAIDIDKEIGRQRELVRKSRGSVRDNAIKVIGYLSGCKKQGITPKDWMITKVPVIPPMFRPVAKLGDTALISDINELYRDVIESSQAFSDLKAEMPDGGLTDERLNIYRAVKAAYGLGDPISPEGQAKNLKGAIRQVIGTSPKFGTFQAKVTSKAVDGVGRAVISPEPSYDMDQCGIPEDAAWTLYRDYVIRGLRRRGYPEERAAQLIDEKAPVAKDLLLEEMGRRPVILDRAPTWHKFNFMAFWPSLVSGSTMRMNPVVEKGFTADHDGDQMNFHVPASEAAVREAIEKMMPSKNLFSTTDLRSPRNVPMMEMTLGLAKLTAPQSKAKPRVFLTSREAIRAYRRGEIGANDPVSILRP